MKNLKFLLLLPVMAWACSSGHGYKITGTLSGLDDSTLVFLKGRKDGNFYTVDSVYANDGKFAFSGTVDNPGMYYLQVDKKRGSMLLFLENAPMEINGNVDSLWMAMAEGSPAQDTFNLYKEESAPYEDASRSLYQQWRNASMAGDTALTSILESRFDSLTAAHDKFDSTFMVNHPNTLVAPYLLRGMAYNMEGDKMDEYIATFGPGIQNSDLVVELKDWAGAKKKAAVGQPAIDFTLADTSGNNVTLSDLYGNYILIDFWAAWCGPCRRENPNVVSAYKQYHPDGFTIVGVSLDRNKEDWLKAIHDDHLTWTQVSDLKYWNSAVPKLYGVRSIPANFLLDPNGVIIAKNLRGEALKKKLAELYN